MSNVNIKRKLPKEDMSKGEKRKLTGITTFDTANKYWYDMPEDKLAAAVTDVVIQIDQQNFGLRQQFEMYAQMYGSYQNLGFQGMGFGSDGFNTETSDNLPTYNIIQSSIDTVHSKVARDNPKPYFITSGADYFVKLRAEKQTQFIQGVFQDIDLYDKANNRVFRDASVYGLGAMQFELNKDTNKIECEWVFIDELKIDRDDAMKGEPRSVHRCKLVSREVLMERYPDQELDQVGQVSDDMFRSRNTVVDLMVVTESWHLRNGKKPGRHTIIVGNKVLEDEKYMEDWFPIVFFRYYENPAGLYGRGITDTLYNHQIEINKLLLMIQQSQELQCNPVWFVDNSSEVAMDVLLSNHIGRAIPYRGGTQPPTPLSPKALSEEVYQHLQWWITSSYQEVGISQTSVSGTKQSGVNSAVAMRTMVDIESSRFIQVSKNWEKFFVDCAEVCIKLGKKAYAKDKNYKITYMDKKSKVLKEIPWNKINSPDDMFVIQCDTISAFSSSAAGRIQTITDFISNGWFSKERGLDLLGLDPDVDGEVKLQTSSLRLCEKRLAEMVEEGIYNKPEPQMNLKLALSVSEAWYNQLIVDDCPEDRLSLVRQWISEIATMIMGNDPQVQLLQSMFNPPPTQATAPQAGLSPANVQPVQ